MMNMYIANNRLSSPKILLIQLEPNFDGIVIGWSSSKLCLAVELSHQDGCHSTVALLLKAGLIQVSDYRLLRASGLNSRALPPAGF
jgi:hypothetical protein